LACEGPALLEELIEGRELTVPMLDGVSLGVIEVVPQRGFYDYTAKYASGSGTSYLLPAPLEPAVEAEVVRVAQEAHRLVGARGVTRVDVMLDGQGRPWILELNSMPGMTATSLVPKAAAARGVPFARFVERMLGMARLERVALRD
jgi:D-alanine--D-alanine ligase